MSLTLLFRAIVPSPIRRRGGGRDTLNGGNGLGVVVVLAVVVVVVLAVVVGFGVVVLGWPQVRSEKYDIHVNAATYLTSVFLTIK
jgi:hypothetical protein